jgi:hypothetical protein
VAGSGGLGAATAVVGPGAVHAVGGGAFPDPPLFRPLAASRTTAAARMITAANASQSKVMVVEEGVDEGDEVGVAAA